MGIKPPISVFANHNCGDWKRIGILRLVEKTPNILELYTGLFPRITARITALGITHPDMRELVLDIGKDNPLFQPQVSE